MIKYYINVSLFYLFFIIQMLSMLIRIKWFRNIGMIIFQVNTYFTHMHLLLLWFIIKNK